MMASISESVCISISHITIHLLNILFRCYISSQEIDSLKYQLKITISPCASHKLFNIFMLCDTFTYFYQLKTRDFTPFSLPLLLQFSCEEKFIF